MGIVISILITLLCVCLVAVFTLRRRLEFSEKTSAQLSSQLADSKAENARLAERLSITENEYRRLNTETETRFRDMANRILLDSSKKISETNRRELSDVLSPMKENIEEFKRSFTERYDKESQERYSLSERVRELVELNRCIGNETRRLSDALKGNSKMQGDWGEMILDNILEHAGLRRGIDYNVQETITGSDGRRLRPDVIIHYTEGRNIIIDSKVSIKAYLGMLDATDDHVREQLAKAHLTSVKKHIAELRDKSYQDFAEGGKVDFVMMFIPHEGAFISAMSLDSSLWQTAYDSRVLIISPTHLMSIIKLVEQMWRHDRQNRNALEIARQAGLMLDKFRGFIEDMERIDRSINTSREAWNSAFNKLTSGSGNLVGRAERLRRLGAKSTKDLPERYTQAEESENESGDNTIENY